MSWWPKRSATKNTAGDGEPARKRLPQAIESLIEQEGDRRVPISLQVRLRTEPVTTVAAQYGYRDGSGADRVIKRLEEEAKSARALSGRLKALAKEVSGVKS